MPEVPEVGEGDGPVPPDPAGISPVEAGRGRAVGPLAEEDEGDEAAGCGEGGAHVEDGPPVRGRAQGPDEMWGGRPEGQRPDEEADPEAAVGAGPRGHDLHADGIDAR